MSVTLNSAQIFTPPAEALNVVELPLESMEPGIDLDSSSELNSRNPVEHAEDIKSEYSEDIYLSSGDINDLPQKIEVYRNKISEEWIWHLPAKKDEAIQKLFHSLQVLSNYKCGIGEIRPPAILFLNCIKALYCIGIVSDEIENRQKVFYNRIFRPFSSSAVVKGATYTGVASLALAALFFGGSFLFEGIAFHVLTGVGIGVGIIGLVTTVFSAVMGNCYEGFRVTETDVNFRNYFAEYFQYCLDGNYEGCKELFSKIPLDEEMKLRYESELLELTNNQLIENEAPPLMMKNLRSSYGNIDVLPHGNIDVPPQGFQNSQLSASRHSPPLIHSLHSQVTYEELANYIQKNPLNSGSLGDNKKPSTDKES